MISKDESFSPVVVSDAKAFKNQDRQQLSKLSYTNTSLTTFRATKNADLFFERKQEFFLKKCYQCLETEISCLKLQLK